MNTARELYQSGRLLDAVSAMNEEVKMHPADRKRRAFLCELLCVAGDLERADRQLEALGNQFPDASPTVSLLRQLVRADTARREFFLQGRAPELIGEPGPHVTLQLRASICLREGDRSEAWDLLQEAEESRPRVAGVCDDTRFDDFRDADDLTAAVFEVLTSTGKYYWIPIDSVETVEFREPAGVLDLLWRRARMVVRGGPDGEVYLPAIYTATEMAEPARLGRITEWSGDGSGPVRGVGLRTYLVGDGSRTIMECSSIAFESNGA